jgi:hypothetical protein
VKKPKSSHSIRPASAVDVSKVSGARVGVGVGVGAGVDILYRLEKMLVDAFFFEPVKIRFDVLM